ncbi:MAG: hypothetical protein QW035_02105 [Candidatus Anstonellales archaeon]
MGELQYRLRRGRPIDTVKLPMPLLDSGAVGNEIFAKKVENLIASRVIPREDARAPLIALRNNNRQMALESIKGLLMSPDPDKVSSGIELARACKATELSHMIKPLERSPAHAEKAKFALRDLS